MSRTDKTRPYAIQRNDHLLPGYEDHDHDSGECDFEALEQWQRRYNDSEHAIRGTNIRRYPCKRVLRRDVRNSRFGDDPTRKGAREVFKRHDRQRVRMGCQQARWLDDEFGEMLTDELTKPQPHKRYYPEDQAYSGGTSKVVRAGVRKYYLRKKREQAETKVPDPPRSCLAVPRRADLGTQPSIGRRLLGYSLVVQRRHLQVVPRSQDQGPLGSRPRRSTDCLGFLIFTV